MTYRVPDTDTVTDHDPDGVQWIAGNVEPDRLTDDTVPADGQTHRTTFVAFERTMSGDPTRPSRADAISLLDPTCPADPDDYRTFALVPAQVVPGAHARARDAWHDLLQAVALAAGRPGSADIPTRAEHDRLWLCADPADFSDDEIEQLRWWGFHADSEGGFYSFRFGGA